MCKIVEAPNATILSRIERAAQPVATKRPADHELALARKTAGQKGMRAVRRNGRIVFLRKKKR